jgi:hypothetical protein
LPVPVITQSPDEHEGLPVDTGRFGSDATKFAKPTDAQPNPPLSLTSKEVGNALEGALPGVSPSTTASARLPERTWSIAVAAPSMFANEATATSTHSGTRATSALRWDFWPTGRSWKRACNEPTPFSRSAITTPAHSTTPMQMIETVSPGEPDPS